MDQKEDVKLSKTILEMKFMKKTKEKVEKLADDLEGNKMYSNEITEEMRRTGNLVFISTSIVNCKNLIDGRLSFGGMNPEIEKLMANEYTKLLEEQERKKEKDVTDAEMAEGYSTLVDTLGKKFNKQKKSKSKKKFVKPNNNEKLL
ncbi:M-phase phosphoprotein 6 [Diorhabda sublineata]|uniref:M-phase phosphoprotein 6 n=1 Tax=Diorhabda sublineata TaxID=1163346 RepID=UPI0024E150BD|nr:M-phase phosphoprotein 6 [Diorhabda sublineata]